MTATVIPGHGLLCYRNANTDLSTKYGTISSVEEFNQIAKIYYWAGLEPTQNNYDFSEIGDDLDYLYAQGGTKYLVIEIPWKRFGAPNPGGFLPAYINALGADIGYHVFTGGGGGVTACVYDGGTVYARWIALLTALGTYLDAHAHGDLVSHLFFSETALGSPAQVSNSTNQSRMITLYEDAVDAFPNHLVKANLNYSISSMAGFLDALVTISTNASQPVAVGLTDINGNTSAGYYGFATLMAEYADRLVIIHNAESPTFNNAQVVPADYPNPTYAGTTIQPTSYATFCLYLLDFAVNIAKAQGIMWLERTPWWSSSIIAAAEAYGPDGTDTFPVDQPGSPPPTEPPSSSSGWTIKNYQAAMPASGSPPIASAVPHSLPATPKLVLFIAGPTTANESSAGAARFSIGATDFTNEWTAAIRGNNSVNPSQSTTRSRNDACLAMFASGGTTWDVEVNDGTPDTTNVNLSYANIPASAFLLDMLSMCGDGLLRCVPSDAIALSTQDTAVPVTAIDPTTSSTFQPNFAIVVTMPFDADDTAHNHAQMSIGIACVDNAAATKQRCLIHTHENGITPTQQTLELLSAAVGGVLSTSDALSHSVELAFTSTGITLTAKGATGAGSYCQVLMGQLSGVDQDIVAMTFPVSGDLTAGQYTHNIGGPLDAGILVGSLAAAFDSIKTDASAGGWFVSTLTPVLSVCNSSTWRDNNATQNTANRSSLKLIHQYDHIGTTKQIEVTGYSLDGTNLIADYGTVAAANSVGFLWRIARAAALDGSDTALDSLPVIYDLTGLGYTDYIRLLGSVSLDERKATGGNRIQVSYDTPAGVFGAGAASYPQFSASDSSPSGSLPASAARPYWNQEGDEFTVTFPAGPETAVASIYINASGCDVSVNAAISDGSADDYDTTLESADTTTGNIVRKRVDISYSATQTGETLTVTCTLDTSNASGGNMTVQAVAIQDDYSPPTDVEGPQFTLGFPRVVSMTETSPGSDAYDVVIGIKITEPGEAFCQARTNTNAFDPLPQQVEVGTDGADDDTDIVAVSGNVDAEFFTEAMLTLAALPGGTTYKVDVAAKDAAVSPNYIANTYFMTVTTPSSGGGGGEGSYSVTVQLDNGAGSVAANTNVEYIWVESDDFGNGQTISGTWTPAVSGSTGLLTVQRSGTDPGHLLVRGENGEFYHSTELTPA